LAQQNRWLEAYQIARIVEHTLQIGDVNQSGGLEYAEYSAMMWQQSDFLLSQFTVQIPQLFPLVDPLVLVDVPTFVTQASLATAVADGGPSERSVASAMYALTSQRTNVPDSSVGSELHPRSPPGRRVPTVTSIHAAVSFPIPMATADGTSIHAPIPSHGPARPIIRSILRGTQSVSSSPGARSARSLPEDADDSDDESSANGPATRSKDRAMFLPSWGETHSGPSSLSQRNYDRKTPPPSLGWAHSQPRSASQSRTNSPFPHGSPAMSNGIHTHTCSTPSLSQTDGDCRLVSVSVSVSVSVKSVVVAVVCIYVCRMFSLFFPLDGAL
jgi:hypothetical protein